MSNDILESVHTVASYELDSFGHANNAVFLNYLEKARGDFMVARGMHFDDFFKWRKYPLVVRANLEFKRPAKAGDTLHITARITAHTQTSFTLQYEVHERDSGHLVLTAETFHVFVDDRNRPTRMPPEFHQNFIVPTLRKDLN